VLKKKSTAKLQESRTVRKICTLDSHLFLAFAGLTADARVLVNRARIECQSYRLTVEDACSVEYMARFIARLQQKYTQRGGRRPFGISTLVCGYDIDGTPHLYQTDPSGTYSEWKANAIGRNSKTVTEFLEKYYDDRRKKEKENKEKENKEKEAKIPEKEKKYEKGEKKISVDDDDDETEPILNETEAIKLAVLALLEVVESGSKNIELAIMRKDAGIEFLANDKVVEIVKQIEEEKEKSGKGKKKKGGGGDKGKESASAILSKAAREAN